MVYNLEERTFLFAKDIRLWVKDLNKSIANTEDIRQLVRASGSVGANYIEANEKFGNKDCLFRMKISRKEAKESAFFLRLIIETNSLDSNEESIKLLNEAVEIRKILSSIIKKLEI